MNKLIGVIKRNSAHLSFFLLFALIFLVGEAVGAVPASRAETAALEEFAANMAYSAEHSVDNTPATAMRAVFSVWAVVLTLWIGGFVPKIPCVVLAGSVMLFKGAATGYTIGMLLRIYEVKGFGLAAVSVLPQYIILLPLMFGAATAAVNTAANVAANAFSGAAIKSGLKGYLALGAVFMSAGIIAALTDTMVTGRLIHILF